MNAEDKKTCEVCGAEATCCHRNLTVMRWQGRTVDTTAGKWVWTCLEHAQDGEVAEFDCALGYGE